MRPETAAYLDKARELLDEAGAVLDIHLNEAAGRTAYLAGFHAAQAFIFEQTGRTPKTHSGVHTQFLQLTHSDQRIPVELRVFLSQSYNLKSVADYGIGPTAKVSATRAQATLDVASGLL
jgi:uncharacterized protein (UPF0332 family)